MGTGDDVNGASTATIAAVRTSSRDELLSAKTQAASTAVAGGDVDVDFVDEHGSGCSAQNIIEAR